MVTVLSMTLNCSLSTQHNIMITLTYKEFHTMLECMDTYGGSFVKSLAVCLRYADPDNRNALLNALPKVVAKYGPGNQFQTKQLTSANV